MFYKFLSSILHGVRICDLKFRKRILEEQEPFGFIIMSWFSYPGILHKNLSKVGWLTMLTNIGENTTICLYTRFFQSFFAKSTTPEYYQRIGNTTSRRGLIGTIIGSHDCRLSTGSRDSERFERYRTLFVVIQRYFTLFYIPRHCVALRVHFTVIFP